MKNRKGSTAALLTLGLVLVGSFVTIGISYLTSTNKIASNPRAEMPTCTAFYEELGDVSVSGSGCAPACGGAENCQECKFAGDIKWECSNIGELEPCVKARTYASLLNCQNDPESDDDSLCTQCKVNDTPRYEYDGPGPGSGPISASGPIGPSGPGGVECKPYNCSNWGFEDHAISYYDRATFYDELGCNKKKKIGDINLAKQKCRELNGQFCSTNPTNCNELDPKYDDRELWVKPDASLTDFYYLKAGCSGTGYKINDPILIGECKKQQGGANTGGGGGNTGVVTIGNLQYVGCGVGTVLPVITSNLIGCANCGGAQSDCAKQPVPGDANNVQFFCCSSHVILP